MPKDTNVVETSNANKVFDIPVKLEPGQINTLSFDQDSISQMRELPNGELEIAFRDGSKVVVENFDELVNSAQSCGRDTLIQLSDNTIIYPEELAAQLAKGPVNFEGNIDAAGAVLLDQPKAGQIIEKNIQAGQEYKLGFSLDSTVSAAQAGQNLILTFKDGGVLVLKNYYTAMESELPPAMTLADGSVIDANALLTSCKLVEIPAIADSLAAANIAEGQVVAGVPLVEPAAGEEKAEEVAASAARKGKAAKDSPPDVEPAAGDEPTDVANIEPAAGDAGNQPASSSRGYGFGSSIDGAALNGADPVGPIGATALRYGAEFPIGNLSPGQDDPFVDTQPIILSSGETVDETNLGPLSVSGNANADFGANGPGLVTLNTSFVPGGSLAGGALTSHGVPVIITLDPATNTYTGTAGGATVFTLVVDAATGNYTFTQNLPLDHADGTDPNDLITLQFGVNATDSDGDVGTGTITIGVCDDAPVAIDDGNSVGSGPFVVTGNVTDNDDAGSDTATVTSVVFNGNTYAVPAVGTVAIVATYGTLVIGATGAYTYTSSNTAEGTDQFTYTLTDFDGDQDTAVLSVTVTDIDTTPTITPSIGKVDETDLSPTSVSGSVSATFGDDGPGTFSFTTATPGGSLQAGALTSHGVPVTLGLVGNTYTGTAGGVTVFTIVLNPATGAYTFTQFAALDHADGANPNDVITLQFGVNTTDTDGDAASTTITISVLDDAPVAANDGNTVVEGTTSVGGNVLTNDDANNDGSPLVTQVVFNGTPYAVPAVGTVSITGAYGTLVIGANGAYTYTSSNTAEGTDVFTYTMKDYDNDTATAQLSLTIADIDSTPKVTPAVGQVDETNLTPTSVSGSVGANFGDDAPGSFALTGTSVPGGSLLGGNLTSNGVAVTTTQVGNVITGSAAGVTVFTLTLDSATGAYTFVQSKPLDHADGSNANDVITLQFGVNATDSDGDTAPTTITISVLDDAPVAANDTATIDPNTLSVGGNVTDNDNVGQDVPGYVVTQVTFGGTTVAVPATGTVTVNGTYGSLTIAKDGSYTYTSFNTGEGTDRFVYQIRDRDGDTATAKLSVTVPDIDTCPVIGDSSKAVDETNLGPNVVGGNISGNFGDDGPGSFSLTSFSFGGSVKGGVLQSCGDAITVSKVNGNYFGIDADGVTVFTLTLNAATGDYTFTQFKAIDHANTSDPNDALTLRFGVTGTDSDGDADTGTITITVLDDGPRADDDHNEFDSNVGSTDGNVITGVNGGPGADDVLSNDGGNKVTNVSYKGVDYPVPTSGETTINGDYGVLKIQADGSYTYTLYSSGGGTGGVGTDGTFSETVEFPVLVESQPVGEAFKGMDPAALDITANSNASVTILSEGAAYKNTLGLYTIAADGTIGAVQIVAANVNDLALGTTTNFDIPANGAGVGFFLIANGFTHNGGYSGQDLSTGNLVFYYHYGEPDQRLGKVTDKASNLTLVNVDGLTDVELQGAIYHTTDRGAPTTINHDNKMHVVSGLADDTDPTVLRIGFEDVVQQGDKDFNDVVFDFTYTPSGPQDTCDEFTYTLTDCDGDTDTAILKLCSEDLVDDKPVLTAEILKVDETIVDNSGAQTVNGTVTVNFGADVPGPVIATGTSSFAFSGSAANGNLTSNGAPVAVTLVGNQYVGTAAGVVIFTLTVNANGTFAFTQNGQLDHADKTNPDDVITLNFGVQATDGDGDTGTTSITINVYDDGPVAANDSNTVGAAPGSVSGNVTANDDVGEDEPGYVVKQITFGGTTVDVPTTGTINIAGAHGTLTIASNGAYTYQATSAGADQFVYKILDQDGDPATAKLTITVNDLDTCPTAENTYKIVDETDLDNSGTQTVNGNLVVDYRADGVGTTVPTGAGSFNSTGSIATGSLKSMGSPVTVTLTGDTYTGTSADGRTIFTLKINTDATYTFKLLDQLDHADKTNPDDIIALNFGYTARDTDDDTATAVITIKVKDDGPVAANDSKTVGDAPGSVSGNVTTNDDVGADKPGYVVKQITFGTTTVDVPATGTVNIVGAHGTLTIAATGAYTYNGTSGGVDQFTYKIVDYDGDPATAKLTITVEDCDDQPTIKNVDVCVDESYLGPISVNGNTQPNFFGDGPGTVKATGASTFVAGGSLLGGSLKSNGVAVLVTLDTATNTYTGKAGDTTVFNIKINNDGTFKFTQFDNLDHANASNPNDEITLKFGVTAKDADGDVATGTITVTVKDDAPCAVDDCYTIESCGCAKIGNVLLNDHIGQDSLAKAVKSVTYNGKVYDLGTAGSTTIEGANGKLVLNADGSFVYKPHNDACGIDQFKYTITDFDKDPSSAYLKFNVEGDGHYYSSSSSVTVTNSVTISTSEDVSVVSHNDLLVILENSSVVTLNDFDPGEGDVIDLSALVQGFDPVTDAINDFVFARTEGKDTVLSVDPDGKGATTQSYDVAVIKDVTGVHVEDIVQLSHTQQSQGGLGTV